MTGGVFSAVADLAAARQARSALRALMHRLGGAGLNRARELPGLLAALDQHAAAVRDSLYGDLRPLSAVTLAGYAQGIEEAAAEYGWHAPPDTSEWVAADWATADWVLLRLLAVCHLAEGLHTP